MFRGLHVGIDHYADPDLQWLTGAVRDAEALHALFADTFGTTSVALLTDKAATASAIRAALATLAEEADADDIVVITYAGHGSENHYLIPHDGAIRHIPDTCISLGELPSPCWRRIRCGPAPPGTCRGAVVLPSGPGTRHRKDWEAMEPLVDEIMRLIEAGADDPRLRWSPDRMTVRVVFSRLVLDGGSKLTASGRRLGFGDAWHAAMTEHGWVPAGPRGVFARRVSAAAEGRRYDGSARPEGG